MIGIGLGAYDGSIILRAAACIFPQIGKMRVDSISELSGPAIAKKPAEGQAEARNFSFMQHRRLPLMAFDSCGARA